MLKFALKNIYRYKLRSLLTLIVIMVSAFTSIFSMGFYQGLVGIFLDGFINYQVGHIKITTPQYLENERFLPVYQNIKNISSLQQELQQISNIKQVVPTYKFYGLVGVGENTYPVSVIALDLQNNSFNFPSKLKQGIISDNGLLIGEQLQKKIGVSLNQELLVVSTSVEGGLNAIKNSVTGIFSFGMRLLDVQHVFMNLSSAQKLLRSGDATTEIYLFLDNINDVDQMVSFLQQKYPDFAIESYKKQMGAFYSMFEIQKYIMAMFTVFVMFLGSLIIVNSLLASVYERMTEIGMLKAIGFTDTELAKMFFYEGSIYGIIGGLLGFLIGISSIYYLSIVGIDISTILQNTTMPVPPVLYPHLTVDNLVLSLLIVVLTPGLVALIPSKHIKKITPIEALSNH
ncbi:MAG: ABC transporter permease [Brevinema sp.]